jgi:hypothetical protein
VFSEKKNINFEESRNSLQSLHFIACLVGTFSVKVHPQNFQRILEQISNTKLQMQALEPEIGFGWKPRATLEKGLS